MTELARFFDSVSGDRVYSSDAWADIFGSLMRDGYVVGQGDELEVTPSTPDGMTVEVGSGVAFIQGRYYENEDPIELVVPDASATLGRIDRVVVRLDYTARTISVAYKAGTAASSPAAPSLQRDASRWELSLAQVSVPAAAITVLAGQITNERESPLNCGIAQGPDQADLGLRPRNSTDDILTARLFDESDPRVAFTGDGRWETGSGNAAADAIIRRASAGRWDIDGTLLIANMDSGGAPLSFATLVLQAAVAQTGSLASIRDSAAVTIAAITIDGRIQSADGAETTPGLSFLTDPNTGMYRVGADDLGFSVGGEKVLELTSAANWQKPPEWHYVGTTGEPVFQHGWTNFSAGPPDYLGTRFCLEDNGFVTIEGAIEGGTITNGTVIFTLPVGFRPSAILMFSVVRSPNGIGRIDISATGNVVVVDIPAGTNDFYSLSGIRFSVN